MPSIKRLIACIVTAAFCGAVQTSTSADSDLTWSETYEVPEGEVWLIEWVSPYAVGEIIPMYDLRILEGEYTILTPTLIDRYSNANEENLFALSGSLPAEIRLYAGARFVVANDLLKFSVLRTR